MKLQIKKATTDVTLYLFIQNSSVTTGAGLTGLVFNSASLVAYYVRPLGSATAITLATQTVTGAHADGGFVEVDATNMPGIYRLDLPDAVCATGVNSVVVMLKGATNMAPVTLELELVAYDPQSATSLGLSNLDAAISSRLAPTTASRTLDVTAGGCAGIDWANVEAPTTTLGLTGTTIATTQKVDVETIKTQAVTAAAGVTFPTSIASPTNITAGTITTVTTLTNLPSIPAAWLTAAGIDTGAITAAKFAAGAIDAAALAADAGTEIATAVWASGTRTITGTVTLANGAHGGTAAVLTCERIVVASTTANEPAVKLTGNGTAAGLQSTGGASNGPGIRGTGGATNSYGIIGQGTGNLAGLAGIGGLGGTSAHGILGSGGGAGGDGIRAKSNNIDGAGIHAAGGSNNGIGILALGLGTAPGLKCQAGNTGHGLLATGGGTSGNAIHASTTDGHALELDASGSAKVSIDAPDGITANITGNLSGSVGSVTGAINTAAGTITTLDGLDTAQDTQHSTTQALLPTNLDGFGTLLETTIATLASQTSFTLTAGSADNDAYNGCEIIVRDAATATQKAVYPIEDYVGATKTITLNATFTNAVFTAAVGDSVTIRATRAGQFSVAGRLLNVSSANAVALVSTVTTLTGHTAQTGDSFARLGAPAGVSVSADIAAIQADLPQRITKNVALSGFSFLMVDSTDHATAKTGLTVTATRSLDGAAFGACANAVSEIGNGVYKIDLAAADLNATVVMLKFTATGADQRTITIVTQPT